MTTKRLKRYLTNLLDYHIWSDCSHHKGWIDEGLFITCRRCGAKK